MPEPAGQGFEIDPGVLLGDDQDHAALFVDEKQVLSMRPGNLPAKIPRLFHGEHRRVLDCNLRDSKRFQAVKQYVAIGRHDRI